MQDILLLYGSPKRTDSATHMLLEALAGQLAGEKVHWFDLVMQGKEAAAALRTAQAAVLAFPLYFDSIPSHVLAWMRAAEAGASAGSGCHVYAVINCGFYEGSQCQWAAQSVQHWSAHCGLDWGQALGIGGGPMLLETAKSGLSSVLTENLRALAGQIRCGGAGEDIFLSPRISRTAYKLVGEWHWRKLARQNGLKSRDLYRKW